MLGCVATPKCKGRLMASEVLGDGNASWVGGCAAEAAHVTAAR